MTTPEPHEKEDDNIITFRPRRDEKYTNGNRIKPPPMVNLPPATKTIAGILLLVHLSLQILSYTIAPDAEAIAIAYGSFVPASWTGGAPFFWWTPFSLLTFSLLHGGWLHLGVNLMMLVSIGSALEKTLGRKSFLLIYIGSTIFAALGHLAFNSFSPMPVVGASGGISGLFGAMIVLMQKGREIGFGQQTTASSILPAVILWILISAVFGYLGSPSGDPIAWIAHIGGFLAGIGFMMMLLKRH